MAMVIRFVCRLEYILNSFTFTNMKAVRKSRVLQPHVFCFYMKKTDQTVTVRYQRRLAGQKKTYVKNISLVGNTLFVGIILTSFIY